MIEDCCEFLRGIKEDPSRIVESLTVRDIIKLREHIKHCSECFKIVEDVSREDDREEILFSEN